MPSKALPLLVATLLLAAAPPELPARHALAPSPGSNADLEFLRPVLAGKRVVQLGEDGHGMRESNEIKVRLVRFLVEQMGFRIVAFESSLYLAFEADRRAASAGPQSTLIAGVLGVWHTQELLPLFEAIASGAPGRPRLTGFDTQPIGSNKKRRPDFFRDLLLDLDVRYAGAVATMDRTFIEEYDKGAASRRAYFRAHSKAVIDGYSRLTRYLESHMTALQQRHGHEAPLVAKQEARSMIAYVRQQIASDARAAAEARDRGMAENMRFIIDELYPNERIVVWGHNYHLRHANEKIPPRLEVFPGVTARSMGGWLKPALGRSLYTVGIQALEGIAVDNARAEYIVTPADRESSERRAAGGADSMVFVDLASLRRAGEAWVARPHSARYNGQFAQTLVPLEQYDALLILPRASPPRFLY